MSLRQLKIRYQYRSDESNIIDDFYIPCLSHSILYQRAVGYFTSTSLAIAAKGISRFLEHHGLMQLIASPVLEEEDWEAIRLGYTARENVVTRSLLRQINKDTENAIVNQRLAFLAWLISQDRLDIKIAIPEGPLAGIYHEKIGCFYDSEGNVVAFSGSSNETHRGLYSNFELIEAFCSWREGDQIRVQHKVRDFKKLWENQTSHLKVLDFPHAAKEALLRKKVHASPGDHDLESRRVEPVILDTTPKPRIPQAIIVRDYQKQAIISWFEQNGTGVYEMATGTGKTVTALSTAVKIYEKTKSLGLIILCPYIELVEQWAKEATRFGFNPILAYESRKRWEEQLNHEIVSFNIGVTDVFCAIMTIGTFITVTMQETLRKINRPAMLIADEMHHLGSKHTLEKLPENIRFRLGLSATPQRWYDDEGTEGLYQYFRPGPVFRFGLKEAIEQGFLTPYEYHPHLVFLTEEEQEAYYEISRKIALVVNKSGSEKINLDEPGLKKLLLERARILSRAENKLTLLRDLVKPNLHTTHNIFYCGDAKIGDERQIELVVKLLGREFGMSVHPFTSREDKKTRRKLLERFSSGSIQGLVAIRCLDEGVDIPATQTAYILASSTNPKEFIQRRGRILRKYPGKEKGIIHDFIVLPRKLKEIESIEASVFNIERRLAKRELARALEFANLALNGPQAVEKLLQLKKAYHLLDL